MTGQLFANDPDMRKELREPFPKELIGTLPATSKRPALSYVGHAVVTDRLNKAAPDWAFSIERIKESPDGLHVLGIVGIMTIGGKSVAEVGEPEHQSVWGPELKLAVSDFIKRAAMRFGVALDMWSKEELIAPEPPKPVPPADPRIIRGGPFKGQTVAQMAETDEGRAQLAAWIADPSIRPELAEAAATALDEHDNPVGAGADLQTTDEPEVGEETGTVESSPTEGSQDVGPGANMLGPRLHRPEAGEESDDAEDSPAEGSEPEPYPATEMDRLGNYVEKAEPASAADKPGYDPEPTEPKITAAQRAAIFGIAGSLGWSKEDIYAFAKIESLTTLSKKQAGDLIDRMTLAEKDQVREGA